MLIAQVELLNDPLFERLSKLLDRNVNDLPQEKEHDTATLYEKEDKDDDEVAYEEAEGLDDETGNISLSSDNDQDGESEPEYSEFDATIDQEEQHAGHVEGKNVDEFDFRDDVDNDDDDDDDDDSVTMEDLKALSTFQKQQLELKQQIQVIEAENVAEKPWQLSGGLYGTALLLLAVRTLLINLIGGVNDGYFLVSLLPSHTISLFIYSPFSMFYHFCGGNVKSH